jgi:hypothetical protein
MRASSGAIWGGVAAALPFLLVLSPGRAEDAGEGVAEPGSTGKLERVVAERMSVNEESLASQQRIESISDETEDLLTRYRGALRQIESLRTYNTQMEALIVSQEEEMASLGEQLDQIELVSRDVTPLMLRMIDALDQFVSLDVPFLGKERRERIVKIRKMMRRADVTEAEKFRRIMEAYQVENEYGRTIEAYRSTLDQDGREVTVDFLRVGRIALVYQSLDESQAGVWNQRTRSWDSLDGSFRSSIRQGLRIARKQAAPDLIRLPLPSAEQAEGAI